MKTAKKRLRVGTVLLALLVCALVLAAAYWMSKQQEEIHQLPTQSPPSPVSPMWYWRTTGRSLPKRS